MAKIKLSTNINLDIEDENGNIFKTFSITYKELTRKETKQISKDNKDVMSLFNDSQSLTKKIESVENQVDALKELGKSKELILATTRLNKLYTEQDKLEESFNDIGGLDALLDATKETFDLSIFGKDKEALVEFINDYSDYNTILESIAEDAKEQMGKHH